jgi:PAS domain S-box-containing protein
MTIRTWFERYFAPSHFEELPPLVATTRIILLILCVTAISLVIDDIVAGQASNIGVYLFFAGSTAGALSLTFWGYFLLPRLCIPFIVLIIITYIIFTNEMGLHDYAMQSYPGVIILAGLLLGKRAPLLFAGVSAITIAWLCHAEITGLMPSKMQAYADYADLLSIVIILGATGGVMQVLMNTLTASAERARNNEAQLLEANRQLQHRAQQLEAQEIALRESTERYHALFNRSVVGVYVHDLTGQFMDANDTILTWFGYTREQIGTLNISDFLDEDQLQTAWASIAEILRIGYNPVPNQFQVTGHDGRVLWLEIEASLLYKDGKPSAIHGIAHDITERKQAERAIRESEQKFRSITEQVQDVIFITDLQGTITYISPSSVAVFGWPAADMLNQRFPVFLAERDIPLALAEFERILSTAQTTNDLCLNIKRQDGTEFVGELRAARIYQNGAVCGTIGVIRDITERQRAEEHIRAALQEKEVLLREIHHRVKNNMQVISSLLNLQATLLPDEESRMMFRESQQRIKAMALIHERLYQSENLMNIHFNEYVSHLVHDLYGSYGGPISRIEFTLDIAEVQLELDTAIPCGLIVNELVSNAIKHAFPDETGTVTIRLQRCPEHLYELIIQDDGIGIPEFLDINQLDSLGLQLVKGLVEEQLDGILKLEQNVPGTRWIIRFPVPTYLKDVV